MCRRVNERCFKIGAAHRRISDKSVSIKRTIYFRRPGFRSTPTISSVCKIVAFRLQSSPGYVISLPVLYDEYKFCFYRANRRQAIERLHSAPEDHLVVHAVETGLERFILLLVASSFPAALASVSFAIRAKTLDRRTRAPCIASPLALSNTPTPREDLSRQRRDRAPLASRSRAVRAHSRKPPPRYTIPALSSSFSCPVPIIEKQSKQSASAPRILEVPRAPPLSVSSSVALARARRSSTRPPFRATSSVDPSLEWRSRGVTFDESIRGADTI